MPDSETDAKNIIEWYYEQKQVHKWIELDYNVCYCAWIGW